jgi:hypothetical protein
MFYVIRFNSALAAMNIAPTSLPGELRSTGQAFGKSRGLTPQEAALVTVSEAFGIGYPADSTVFLAVKDWTNTGKIFPNKPEVQEALMSLHLL